MKRSREDTGSPSNTSNLPSSPPQVTQEIKIRKLEGGEEAPIEDTPSTRESTSASSESSLAVEPVDVPPSDTGSIVPTSQADVSK